MREGWNGLDLGKALAAEAAAINAEMPLGMSLSEIWMEIVEPSGASARRPSSTYRASNVRV